MLIPPRMHPTHQALVEENLDLVRYVANLFYRRWRYCIEFDELVSLGVLGLIQAARRFDPNCGAKFSTFAYRRIRGSIYDGIRAIRPGLPTEVETALKLHNEATQPPMVDEYVEQQVRLRALVLVYDELTPRVRTLLASHYRHGNTLVCAGNSIGVSKSRASRIHAKALATLRNRIENVPRQARG